MTIIELYRDSNLTERESLLGNKSPSSQSSTNTTRSNALQEILKSLPIDENLSPEIQNYIKELLLSGGISDDQINGDTPITDILDIANVTTIEQENEQNEQNEIVQVEVVQTEPIVIQLSTNAISILDRYNEFLKSIRESDKAVFENSSLKSLQLGVRNAFDNQYRDKASALANASSNELSPTDAYFKDVLVDEKPIVQIIAEKSEINTPSEEAKTEVQPNPVLFLSPWNFTIDNPKTVESFSKLLDSSSLLDKAAIYSLAEKGNLDSLMDAEDTQNLLSNLPNNFVTDFSTRAGEILDRSLDILTILKKYIALTSVKRNELSRVEGGPISRMTGEMAQFLFDIADVNRQVKEAKKNTEFMADFNNNLKPLNDFTDLVISTNNTLQQLTQPILDDWTQVMKSCGYDVQDNINTAYLCQ